MPATHKSAPNRRSIAKCCDVSPQANSPIAMGRRQTYVHALAGALTINYA
jgi:hypothetical protein